MGWARTKERPQDAARWVTEKENQLAELILELRKEERMQRWGAYKVQFAIEILTEEHGPEKWNVILDDIRAKRTESFYYKQSKLRNLPTEAEFKRGYGEWDEEPVLLEGAKLMGARSEERR